VDNTVSKTFNTRPINIFMRIFKITGKSIGGFIYNFKISNNGVDRPLVFYKLFIGKPFGIGFYLISALHNIPDQ